MALTQEQEDRINGALDEAAQLGTAVEREVFLSDLINELGRPVGLTLTALRADLARYTQTHDLSRKEREENFKRIALIEPADRVNEITKLQPLLGKGWSRTKIETEVQQRVPPMSWDIVDERCVDISVLSEGLRKGAIATLMKDAAKENLVLDRADLEGKVARAAAEAARRDGEEVSIIDPKDFTATALRFVEEVYTLGKVRTLKYWTGCWYVWKGPKWEQLEAKSDEVNDAVRRWSAGKHFLNKEGVAQPVLPNISFVSEVAEAVRCEVVWDISSIDGVMWEGQPPFVGLAMHVKNGILCVVTDKLYSHTPRCFNLTSVDAEWHGDKDISEKPFGKFVASITTEGEQMLPLQEYFGYSLTSMTKMQKGLMLIGKRRSGKGTILRTLGKLLGTGGVHTIPMQQFSNTFPMQGAETAAIIALPDIRTDKNTYFGPVAETMLTAIGEDPLTIQRKHRTPWHGRLLAKWWAIANSVPSLHDPDGVLASRFIYVNLGDVSFFGKEDVDLEAKITADLDSVLIWGVAGLRRLLAQGKFTETSRGQKMAEQARVRQSPVSAWFEENLEIDPTHHEPKDRLFVSFFLWAQARHMGFMTKKGLFVGINSLAIDGVVGGDTGRGDTRLYTLKGVRFKEGKKPTYEDAYSVWEAVKKEDADVREKGMMHLIELIRQEEEADGKEDSTVVAFNEVIRTDNSVHGGKNDTVQQLKSDSEEAKSTYGKPKPEEKT
ncbi:DUF5906 domain-containing protein [Falsihalocynthiibacter sp. S25ZX9]|uniref:DNA primase family protein n=1 Tax=Falsihalocynthiibacter sp. S25ZX9 TaxID=3240870 RepID=UPI0035109855